MVSCKLEAVCETQAWYIGWLTTTNTPLVDKQSQGMQRPVGPFTSQVVTTSVQDDAQFRGNTQSGGHHSATEYDQWS